MNRSKSPRTRLIRAQRDSQGEGEVQEKALPLFFEPEPEPPSEDPDSPEALFLNACRVQEILEKPTVEEDPDAYHKSLCPSNKRLQTDEDNQAKNAWEYLESDLNKAGLNTVLYRLTVVGRFDGNDQEFLELHKKIVEQTKDPHANNLETGMLIVFPQHFLHVFEGSQEAVNKYIQLCSKEFEERVVVDPKHAPIKIREVDSDDEEIPEFISNFDFKCRMVILNYIQVPLRFAQTWYHVLKPNPGHEETKECHTFRTHLYNFIVKAWTLVAVMHTLDEDYNPTNFPRESFMTEALVLDEIEEQVLRAENETAIENEIYFYLPNASVIDYFLKPKERTPIIRTPKEFIADFLGIRNDISVEEKVWPIPCRFAPYD